ncbi:hypothetical protein MKX01_030220 [Papaver californicum]|nr:hypothetical protein MKX01_030220 [Papaver californicum]
MGTKLHRKSYYLVSHFLCDHYYNVYIAKSIEVKSESEARELVEKKKVAPVSKEHALLEKLHQISANDMILFEADLMINWRCRKLLGMTLNFCRRLLIMLLIM